MSTPEVSDTSIAEDERAGLDVVLAVVQGMTSMSHAVTDALIESLQADAHRYRLLRAAIEDFADTQDSRRVSAQLYSILCDVRELRGQALATEYRNVFGE